MKPAIPKDSQNVPHQNGSLLVSVTVSPIFRPFYGDNLWLPIGSMYGIYANIWGMWMVNVTIYSIHGSYVLLKSLLWKPSPIVLDDL